jgi:hypothetical protein
LELTSSFAFRGSRINQSIKKSINQKIINQKESRELNQTISVQNIPKKVLLSVFHPLNATNKKRQPAE